MENALEISGLCKQYKVLRSKMFVYIAKWLCDGALEKMEQARPQRSRRF